MILDQIWQFPDFSSDMDAGGRIWNLYGLEDSPDTLISFLVRVGFEVCGNRKTEDTRETGTMLGEV